MAKKRLRKKQEKRRLQQEVNAYRGKYKLTEKEVEKQSYSSLKSISQKEHKRQEYKQAKLRLRNRKAQYLQSIGIDPFTLRLKDIDSLKVKDMESGTVNRANYPNIYGIKSFDFDRPLKLKNNNRIYFAFRDFTGETSLEEILQDFSGLSDAELLQRLEFISSLPPVGRKGSNGKAGDFKFMVAPQSVLKAVGQETYNANRRKKTKTHPGAYKGFQVLKNGRYNSFDTVTPHNLLVIANAFMHNITENDRQNFYARFYTEINKHFPEFGEILPTP